MKFSQFSENCKLSFHSPITQVEGDSITDIELERAEEITFRTPSGKEVPFRKVKRGEWNAIQSGMFVCPFCGARPDEIYKKFCPNCGADMRGKLE